MRIGGRLLGVAISFCVVAPAVGWAQPAQTDRVQPVPLGGKLSDQSGDRYFGVYVPTRFGGVLTVTTTEGTVDALAGPDGRPRTNGQEVGMDQQGWYTFKVTGADKPYEVDTTFVQVGESTKMPWNFYYWPTKGDAVHEPWSGGNGRVDTPQPVGDDIMVAPYGSYIAPGQDIILPGPNGLLETPPAPGDESTWFPNLYDDLTWRGGDGTWYTTPAPLLKYDQLFNQSARSWEAANSQNQDIQRWPGHCLGGAVASIMLNEPSPPPVAASPRTNSRPSGPSLARITTTTASVTTPITSRPDRPDPASTNATPTSPDSTPCSNDTSEAKRRPSWPTSAASPPPASPTRSGTTASASSPPSTTPSPARTPARSASRSSSSATPAPTSTSKIPSPASTTTSTSLLYGVNGEIDEVTPGSTDWISVGGDAMYAPLNVMQVVDSRWQGHNPMVNEGEFRSVDMANGGGGQFLSATPPSFRPVGTYEAGRGPRSRAAAVASAVASSAATTQPRPPLVAAASSAVSSADARANQAAYAFPHREPPVIPSGWPGVFCWGRSRFPSSAALFGSTPRILGDKCQVFALAGRSRKCRAGRVLLWPACEDPIARPRPACLIAYPGWSPCLANSHCRVSPLLGCGTDSHGSGRRS